MAQKTGWGMLNYTRSKDVADRQHRNYVACLRAGYASRTMDNLLGKETAQGENPKLTASITRAANRFSDLHNSIPSRDSAMS